MTAESPKPKMQIATQPVDDLYRLPPCIHFLKIGGRQLVVFV